QRHAAGVDPVDRLVRVAALGPPDIAGTRGLLVPLPGGLDPSVHRLGERLPLPIDQLPAPVVMPDGCRTAGEPFDTCMIDLQQWPPPRIDEDMLVLPPRHGFADPGNPAGKACRAIPAV